MTGRVANDFTMCLATLRCVSRCSAKSLASSCVAARCKLTRNRLVISVSIHVSYALVANAGDFSKYYCRFQSAHFNASWRIRKGPAPLDLGVHPPPSPQTVC
ncbi:hypothetical protein PYW08_000741 [Mythimna loreyi]|uniref:Uncharacterized protein n=1 Tax=Mythimna loreyi TaxID=667449 RepID=A0ACC2QZE5_9NEOP|nr:hypothetical protein PYW08_000741 [Mythimna loreyi]